MTNATVWRCPKCQGRNFSVPKPGCKCAWCGYEIPKGEKKHADHKCGNCAHWGDGKAFSAYGMDFCCREDSVYYNDLMNSDSYCKAWEPKPEPPKEE